jgi:hypothetical protein
MQPLAARRERMGFGGKAGRDETGREGTLQHVRIVRDYSRASQSFLRVSRYPNLILFFLRRGE